MGENQKIEGGKEIIKHGAMHVVENRGSSSAYDLDMGFGTVLSISASSQVVQAKHLASKQVYACKTIRLSSLQTRQWEEDLQRIKALDSPHICKLFEAWEEGRYLYLILELCRGGDLTSLVRSKAPNEGTISVLVRQMLGALAHLHQHGIVHGDLKCQDWLFADPIMGDTKVFQMQLKMIDFGFAAKHYSTKAAEEAAAREESAFEQKKRRHKLQDQRLPICQAPEQIDRTAPPSPGADVWALGVLCFFLLGGQPPFSRTKRNWKEKIRAAEFSFEPAQTWHHVTRAATNFVSTCMHRELGQRPPAADLLESPWMTLAKEVFDEDLNLHQSRMGTSHNPHKKGVLSILDAPLPSAETILSSFKRMHQLGALEKAAMTAAAYHLHGDKMVMLRTTFEKMDKNGDGVLTAKELMEGLQASGVSAPELMEILKDVDLDGDGVIEYTEFITATHEFQKSMQDHTVASVFRVFDQDGSGKVSKSEILSCLGHQHHRQSLRNSFPELNLDGALEHLDRDGDGQIDADEFKELLHYHSKKDRRH